MNNEQWIIMSKSLARSSILHCSSCPLDGIKLPLCSKKEKHMWSKMISQTLTGTYLCEHSQNIYTEALNFQPIIYFLCLYIFDFDGCWTFDKWELKWTFGHILILTYIHSHTHLFSLYEPPFFPVTQYTPYCIVI